MNKIPIIGMLYSLAELIVWILVANKVCDAINALAQVSSIEAQAEIAT